MARARARSDAAPTAPIAVLTGVVIAPEGVAARDLARAVQEAGQRVVGWYDPTPKVGRRPGGGWQIVPSNPVHGPRAALAFRAHIRALGEGWDCRVAIGVGAAPERWSPARDPAACMSPAFAESVGAFEAMPRHRALVHDRARGPYGAAIALLDTLSATWTPAQARVVVEALAPEALPQVAIARRLGISQPTVSQILRAAHGPALRDALRALETAPI